MTQINPANFIKAINLYPGSGEYVYEVNPVFSGEDAVNIHNDQGKADARLSIEQLKTVMPNLQYVSIMINWFASSLNAGEATILPKVESQDKEEAWQVGEYTRKSAPEMHYSNNGDITFGGTPTDKSVVELVTLLKEQGYKVMISPLLMVDDDSLSKPWRGYIAPMGKKTTKQKDIEHFFKSEHGYNKFVLHYAELLKGSIDSVVIGSELKGLTSAKINEYLYPAIGELKTLAALVRGVIGPDVKITYSANWGDEYHNSYLDPLWCDANIDWVGISAYFPLTDNLPQNEITYDKVKAGWTSGEGVDFYRQDGEKKAYTSQEWAWGNVEYWWSSFHHKGSTCWTPKMKPVILTEYGFPSIDGATNQPNFYYEPTGYDDHIKINNLAQSTAIAASEVYFAEANKHDSNFLPWNFLYVWDARPHPYFPNNCQYWSDCKKHSYGHAVNGKLVEVEVPQSDIDMLGVNQYCL
jgi:hypothetical protein